MERIMHKQTALHLVMSTRRQASATPRHQKSALWTACWLAGLTSTAMLAQAAPLTLATAPPGGGREPAPNVIVSVDDSGSMGWDVQGCVTLDFKRVSGWYSSWFNQASPAPSPACPTASLANATANTNPSRMASLKAALLAQFNDTSRTPDNRIRLAWQSMWGHTPSTQGSITNQLTLGATNSMKPLAGTHRSNFVSWVNSLTAYNGTPSHKLASDAFNYMRSAAGTNSPWADTPGTAQATPYLACRRTYHILMTDGAWNDTSGTTAAGNADGTNRTLPDGIAYNTASDQVRAYKDAYGGATGNLSDHAFKAWATDLQDGTSSTQNMANSVKPLIRQAGTAAVDATTLEEYWNPKNDPATWQHIVTHTIGFGKAATVWTGDPVWNNVTDDTYGGDYSALVNGTKSWQNQDTEGERSSELWHAALNGRGKFYPARDASALNAAFTSILDNIIADTSKPLVSISASTSSLRTTASVYIAGYDGADWSGRLTSYPLNTSTGALATTPTWRAAGNSGETPTPTTYYGLDVDPASTMTSRLVLSDSGTAGISWKWSNLSSGQQDLVKGADSATVGEDRLNWVRGVRTKEVAASPSGPFRNRSSRLGDIVTSNIWYTSKPSGGYSGTYSTFRTDYSTRPPMIYVGANDGMLHGFDATTGAERLAYVPRGLLSKFVAFSKPSYTHQYFVDGQPFVGDAYLGATDGWQSLLVSGLGGGGKGYFVLNVTNPADTGKPNVFAEANAAALVKLDTTASTDADLGHIYSPPIVDDARPEKSGQIVKMNNDRWAVVMGNGYNSANEKPVLLIQYVDGDKALVKLGPSLSPTTSTCPATTCQGDGNGLSVPRLLDLNGDGRVDIAYAGDLKGNLWKFNLADTTPSNNVSTATITWSVAFSGAPFFVAGNSLGVRQPITTAPYTMSHPSGGVMLAFGTGRNVTTTDHTTAFNDTMWGIHDNSKIILTSSPITFTESGTDPVTGSPYGSINSTVSITRPTSLVQQTQSAPITDTGGKLFYEVTRNAVPYTGASRKRGWYMDWPTAGLPTSKMRVLHNPTPFYGERILVQSTIPQAGGVAGAETCTPSALPESTFISVFNMFTGHPSVSQVFRPVDGSIAVGNLGISQVDPGDAARLEKDGEVWLRSTGESSPGSGVGTSAVKKIQYEKGLGVRSNWREYQ
jgi:type IV pilus assembly protein PilY1